MTDDRCRWNGSAQPRTVPGRHEGDCQDDACRGCAPCPSAHCRVCGIAHTDGTCAECMAEVRDNLREIGRLCDALPEEVEHRGVEGEAMMLLLPACNPEARGHLEASVRAGRLSYDAIDARHLKDCANPRCTGCATELHPETVLGTWDAVWRDALDHDEPVGRFDMGDTIDYLDRTMSYMGTWPHVPFEDFAHDLRRSRGHLEAVLHDGEQRDTGAPCLSCEVPLVREWGTLAAADGWRCPRCKTWRSDEDYRRNVAHLHRAEAKWLTDRDMEIRVGVKAATVRSWSRDKGDGLDPITKRTDSGRTVYSVLEVEGRARAKGLLQGGVA